MSNPTAILREHSLELFQAGIAAANPQLAVQQCLLNIDGQLQIRLDRQGRQVRVGEWSKIHVIAFGKAACAMIRAAWQALPKQKLAETCIAVTTYDNVAAIDGIEILGAGHPLPDENGLQAALRIETALKHTTSNELVLTLISGGGSALLPYPVDGVTLKDKIATTQLLLACGANINQINCVRKHLSKIKGGGLAKLAAPAALHALILSDVLGDDLSSIASGPTVADISTFADAITVLKHFQVWEQTPPTVKQYLLRGEAGLQPETLKPEDPIFQNTSHTLIGSNKHSVDAVFNKAQKLGYQTQIYSQDLQGESRLVAEQWVAHSKQLQEVGLNQPTALIAGGETTVTLTGNGNGGRNQEMALAFALAAEKQNLKGSWTFLSGGTDGRDGPTDAAGGSVDQSTLKKIRAAGIDPFVALNHNDSYPALKTADALVITGATGTNVADLQILLMHPLPIKNPSGERHV